jgi:hypothetical protein
MSATFIGLNLAKSVFQIHGVDAHGKVVVTKRLRREAVLAFSREGRGSASTGPISPANSFRGCSGGMMDFPIIFPNSRRCLGKG